MKSVESPDEKARQIGVLIRELTADFDTRITALENVEPPPDPDPPDPPEPGKLHGIGSWYMDMSLKNKLGLDMSVGMFTPTNPANLRYLCDTLGLDTVQALIYGPHLGWNETQMLQAAETVGRFSIDHPQITLLLDDFWATADDLGHRVWEDVIRTARSFNADLKVYIVVYPFQIDRHLYEGWTPRTWPDGVSLWIWDHDNTHKVGEYCQQIDDKYHGALRLQGGVYVTDYLHGGNQPIPKEAFQYLLDYWCSRVVDGTGDGSMVLFYPAALQQWPEYVDYANEVYDRYR